MPESYKARIEAMRPQFEAMALQQYGLEIKAGPSGIDSRPALIGAKYAEQHGQGEGYHKAVFQAYWQQSQRIDDLELLADIAAGLGLDRQAFMQALQDPALEEAVDADIVTAQAIEISGVPAMVIANKYLIPGAQPYDELTRIVDYVATREDQSPE